MSTLAGRSWVLGQDDPADSRWQLVLRIAESAQFRKSPKLRELLLFVCDRGLQNATEDLKEQRIGWQVFGRRPDYNPSEDNIVRVEIRQLRKRLDEYFASAGKDEPVIVTVPKGSYIPSFEARRPETPKQEQQEIEFLRLAAADRQPTTNPRDARPWIWQAIAGVLAVLCVLSWLPGAKRFPPPHAATAEEPFALWPELFNKTHDTYIVCADSGLVILQDLTKTPVTLNEYIARAYPKPDSRLAPGLNELTTILPHRQYTSIADVHMVERLLLNNSQDWDRTSIRSARTLQVVDFKRNNFVLLGSSRANPWGQLFEPQLNFAWSFDEQRRQPVLKNRRPKPGELAEYRTEATGGDQSYSVVDFVPNLSRTGNVLIVAGATMEGTEGASDFVTSPAFAAQLSGPMHALRNGKVLYFELVLQSGTLGGTSEASRVVAFRILPADPAV